MHLDRVTVEIWSLSYVKGVNMEITRQTWKDVAGLRERGVQVRKGETTVVDEFNKV